MDVTQVTELRSWAARLEERATDPELRAAGKAIHMLVDEVESLEAKLTEAKAGVPVTEAPAATGAEPTAVAHEPGESAWEHVGQERTQGSFFSRLKKSFGLD
jgi:hypothetical protein